MGHVQREIDQDVDLVLADDPGQILIGAQSDVSPQVGVGAEHFREHIGPGDAGITANFKSLVIVLAEQRENILSDNVLAKIRRDVTDPQPPIG